MIRADAKLSIQRIELGKIILNEFEERYLDQLLRYIELLKSHPDEYAGLLYLVPSDTYPGLYVLLDGHTRFCANIMAGRRDVLAVVEENA